MTEDASPRGLDTLFFRNRHLLWLSIIVILVGALLRSLRFREWKIPGSSTATPS